MKIYRTKYLAYFIQRKLRKASPRWLVLSVDLYITLNVFLLSYGILKLLNIGYQQELFEVALYQLPQVLVFSLIAFLATASYRGVIRHTSFRDIVSVFKAMVLYGFLLTVNWLVLKVSDVDPQFKMAKSLILLHVLLSLIGLTFLRILYKSLYFSFVNKKKDTKCVMIYGAGESGVITYKLIRNDNKSRLCVFGFVDDNKKVVGKKIDGVKVYHSTILTQEYIAQHKIAEIIISIQNIKPSRLREIYDQLSELPLTIRLVPNTSTWLKGDLTLNQIKKVKIEDLLGRTPIELNNQEVLAETQGKVIMVTGAAGSIGSEISRQLMNCDFKKLIMVDQAESDLFELQQSTLKQQKLGCKFIIADVRNFNQMEALMNYHRPDLIFHAAAYKHVPLMEDNPYEAIMANIKGTKTVADLAVKFNCGKFVMVSTDKAVNPTNVMGATKRVAELYVNLLNQKFDTNFIVTRFGNVLGSNGSVIPTFKRQIEEGGPLTLTHPDITRYFMTIPEACQLVLEAGAMGKGGEVFVFDMGQSVKIMDLAKKLIQLSGLRYPQDIDIKITGLRPGEKIYEELLATDENTMKTHHPKIMIAKVQRPPQHLECMIKELYDYIPTGIEIDNNMFLVSKIKEIVPEFKSNNSVYCSLDQAIQV